MFKNIHKLIKHNVAFTLGIQITAYIDKLSEVNYKKIGLLIISEFLQ